MNYNHRTNVERLGLPVENLLDTSVADQDEFAGLKVEINDAGSKALLETAEMLAASLHDFLSHPPEVLGTPGKLTGSESNGSRSGDSKVLRR